MKVLFISEGYSIGGTSKVMSRLSDIFVKNGIQVDFLVANYKYQESPPIPDGCHFFYASKDKGRKNKLLLALDLLIFIAKLRQLTRYSEYQYVISFWNYVNLILILTPLNSQIKKIVCSHISYQSLKPHWKILTRIFYPFAQSVVVLNEREKDVFQNFCHQVIEIENPLPKL